MSTYALLTKALNELRAAGEEPDPDLVAQVEALGRQHAAEYEARYGVTKGDIPQRLSKQQMDLLLANPAIYDDMVSKGLLP